MQAHSLSHRECESRDTDSCGVEKSIECEHRYSSKHGRPKEGCKDDFCRYNSMEAMGAQLENAEVTVERKVEKPSKNPIRYRTLSTSGSKWATTPCSIPTICRLRLCKSPSPFYSMTKVIYLFSFFSFLLPYSNLHTRRAYSECKLLSLTQSGHYP